MDELYTLAPGESPLLIGVPHAGTFIPPPLRGRLTAAALALPDTDWHVHRLYAFARAVGAGLLVATYSRYLIDLNRNPAGQALYPGADNTELCPLRTFGSEPIYAPGAEPDAAEIAERVERYFAPYHQVLAAQLAARRQRFGYAVLLDGHSIRAEVPRFFTGRLPDLNLGSADGRSAAASLQEAAWQVLAGADGFTCVCNGRFKGGYITRHYGQPDEGVHVLQLEMAQDCYMDESHPETFDPARTTPLAQVLQTLVRALLNWRPGAYIR